ncbi:DUF4145 domain-containing protein [Fulvivirga maritima]|uniref:DUF4145 domain-containing protein n=1 Tax=Fulvivirga maritima TaxID=2904247 RepID=UPI001F2127D7|nr:DUF4145 domain-containing protein [Fulvivirga maritima]UII25108.1 DUF4145 domain-containing protein [Fulvivirga maritima]
MKNIELIKKICSECIVEGESLLITKWEDRYMGGFVIANPISYVDLEGFKKWKSNCNVLINLLGELADPWKEIFHGEKGNTLTNTTSMIGGLKSINDTIDKGYLVRIEDIIYAEAFSNLIDQAEYLFDQGYFLASGVISRAVLEEKLRAICDHQGVVFSKHRPTLSDFNGELYKNKFYDKIEFKNFDYLASVGNHAAHNQPITKEDISKLIRGVTEALSKY